MTVEGGLEEPEELQPEQGSLALLLPEDEHRREDWDKAAAGGAAQGPADERRRPRRGGLGPALPDDPRRHRRHRRSAPPTCCAAWTPRAARPAPAPGTSGRASAAATPRRCNAEALADLDGGATSLWLAARRHRPGRPSSTACSSTSRRSSSTRRRPRPRPRRSSASLGGREPHPGTNLGVPAPRPTTPTLAVADRPRRRRPAASSSTPPRSTTAAPPTPRSSPGRWPPARAYLRTLTDAGFDVDDAAGAASSSGTPPPTSSSRRSPSSAPPAGSGAGCSSSAATERRDQRQHVVTSRPMMSKYDPWVNMLRTTVAAFAAGVGGADARHRAAVRQPARHARTRSAAGSPATPPHLLIDESHVARVADPAGGSYAVEKLTDDLASRRGRSSAGSRTAPTWTPDRAGPSPQRDARDRAPASGRSPG